MKTKKILHGARVDFIELRMGKPVEEILRPYIQYHTPARLVGEEIGVPVPTVRYWLRVIRKKMKV